MKQNYRSDCIVLESKFEEHTREEVAKVMQHYCT